MALLNDFGGSLNKLKENYIALECISYAEGYVTINTYDWYINKLILDAVKAHKKIDFTALGQAYISLLEEWITHYIDIYHKELGFDVVHTLLLHDSSLNALYLDDILTMIKNKGWNIVSPEEAFGDTSWRKGCLSKAQALTLKPASLN